MNSILNDQIWNHPIITYDDSALDYGFPAGIPNGDEYLHFKFGQWEEQ